MVRQPSRRDKDLHSIYRDKDLYKGGHRTFVPYMDRAPPPDKPDHRRDHIGNNALVSVIARSIS